MIPTINDRVEWSGYDREGNLCILTGDIISVNNRLKTVNICWATNPMRIEFHAHVPWSHFDTDEWELIQG